MEIELGNLVFGHSRGEYAVPRDDAWQNKFFELQDAVQADSSPYGVDFENDVFELHTYWWGECSCKANDEEHEPTCGLVRPNSRHKVSGYELMFYKYAIRSAYSNKSITIQEFATMIDECIKSIEK